MTQLTKIRLKDSVLLVKQQSTAGTYVEPSASSDAVRSEEVTIAFNPQTTTTNENQASLDPNAPIIGGVQVSLTIPLYLRGSGVPGVAAEYDDLMQMCAMTSTVTKTDITGIDFSTNSGTSKFLAASTVITALTAGTVIYTSGFVNAPNNGEFLVASIGSGFVVVTKIDGSAPGLVTETAGASVTVRYGIPGTAAASGTTISAVLASPFAATSELYRFMPAVISGNPATPFTTFFQDYTAGRAATFTDLFASALTTSSIVSIPANVSYTPCSSGIPNGSIAIYCGGKVWKFLDAIGSCAVDWAAAGVVKVTLTISAKFNLTTDASVPTVTSYDATLPGVWRGSRFLLNRTPVSLTTLSIDMKATMTYPPNPNDPEGFDAPFHDSRNVTGTMDPHMSLTATRDNLNDFKNMVQRPILATLQGAPGGMAGNRCAMIVPAAQYTTYAPGKDGSLYTDQTGFFCQGQDSGVGFAIW